MFKFLFTLSLLLSPTCVVNLDAGIIRPGRPRTHNGLTDKPQKPYSDSTLIIFYDGPKGKESLMVAIEEYGATLIYDYENLNSIAIKLPHGKSVEDAKSHFEKVEGVTQVNFDRIKRMM